MTIGFVFPGQGAQTVGMLADLRATYEHLDVRLKRAADLIDEDLVGLITDGPSERLNATEITQPVMLALSVALFEVWREVAGGSLHAVAGHSLGEYSALTAAGVFEFDDAVRLVNHRGRLMQAAVPSGAGQMAAVIGVDLDELESLCEATVGVVSPANINSPSQVVIAGEVGAVEALSATILADGDKRKRVVPLDVSVPSHCQLMAPAADGVAQLLMDTPMQLPVCPIYQNVDAQTASDVAGIRERLIRQLSSPVRWADCVTAMQKGGCEVLIECGPGKVLTSLARRIDRRLKCVSIGSVDDFKSVLAGTTG